MSAKSVPSNHRKQSRFPIVGGKGNGANN